jgi:hypothetical protein
MTQEEAIGFLNKEGRAYEMWKQMMHAGEEYLKAALDRQTPYEVGTERSRQRRLAV